MVKIFFFLMILSTPNQPSVKYTAAIYTTEEQCNNVLTGYINAYESKSQEYKEITLTEAFCIPFHSFNIEGMKENIGA